MTDTKKQPESVRPEHNGSDANDARATRFDGNPAPESDGKDDVFMPQDDTPAFLEKREGPKPK